MWVKTARIAIVSLALCAASAKAGDLTEFNAAVEDAASHNRVAAGYLRTGNLDLAGVEDVVPVPVVTAVDDDAAVRAIPPGRRLRRNRGHYGRIERRRSGVRDSYRCLASTRADNKDRGKDDKKAPQVRFHDAPFLFDPRGSPCLRRRSDFSPRRAIYESGVRDALKGDTVRGRPRDKHHNRGQRKTMTTSADVASEPG